MSKASKMIQAMDQLQITQKPYKAHYLTECDQKIRQQYLQLLFSVVSLEGFNDAQQRIWQLLSQSIGVDGTSSDEMNSELIQTVVQSCVENKLQHVFILDLLVLLRLNTVSDEQARILAELISLFALSDQDVDTLIHLSDLILCISDKGQNLTEFKYETIRHWHEFSYQILTKELLVAGLNGGRWIQLNDITEVNKPININHSSLYCMGEKQISVSSHPIKIKGSQFDVNLKAEDCTLEILETNFANQSIELFGDENEAFFEDCNFARVFEASYNDPTYLNCPKGTLKINRCNFQLENIATINFTGTKITVENSVFEKCGNPKGHGAIIIGRSTLEFKNNRFINCISREKGNSLTCLNLIDNSNERSSLNWTIVDCIFDNEKNKGNSMSIFIEYINQCFTKFSGDYARIQPFIERCLFANTDVYLSLTCARTRVIGTEIIDSKFTNAQVQYLHKAFLKFSNCEFENDGKPNVIEIPEEA